MKKTCKCTHDLEDHRTLGVWLKTDRIPCTKCNCKDFKRVISTPTACHSDRLLQYVNEILEKIATSKHVHIDHTDLEKLEVKAIELAEKLRGEFVISTTSPKSIAVCIVYLASVFTAAEKKKLSQLQVATIAGLSHVTLRNNLPKITKLINK